MQRLMVPLFLVGLLPVGAEPPPAAGVPNAGPRNRAAIGLPAPQRISAELRDLTLAEAATRLGSVLGVRIHVPPPVAATPAGSAPGSPDYDRKRSFSWRDTPLADALRQFCRDYGCSLGVDYRGNLTVLPVPLATGPVATVAGYQVQVESLNYSDSRSFNDLGEFTARRFLSLQFTLRAASDHAARIYALENVRVEDQAGRDVLDKAGRSQPLTPAAPRAFPDERGQNVRLEWPYPRPERLRLIEGDLVLYRRVSPQQVEFDLPAPGQTSEIKEIGDVHCQLVQVDASTEGFRTTLRVMCPAAMGVLLNGVPSAAEFVLPDGKRVPAAVTGMGWGMSQGWKSMDFFLYVNGRADLRGRLKLRFIRQEDPERRLHFRITDFPYPLSPAPQAAETGPGTAGGNVGRSAGESSRE